MERVVIVFSVAPVILPHGAEQFAVVIRVNAPILHQRQGIAVDNGGNVFVTTLENCVLKFNASGVFVAQWGTYGAGEGQFNSPRDAAADASGDVYVVDTANRRYQVFPKSWIDAMH